jgi:hypothetical protein
MKRWLATNYTLISLALALVFGLVGLFFLIGPNLVISKFNALSEHLGFRPAAPAQADFFLILAAAYMAVVTFLAWLMYRHPEDMRLPLILSFAKFTSSLLSFAFFIGVAPYLIYLANGVVDGFLGLLVLACRGAVQKGRGGIR